MPRFARPVRRFFRVSVWLVPLLLAIAPPDALPRPGEAPAPGARAPKVGEKAPAFKIQGFSPASLRGKKNLLLVFYRGHF